MKRCSYPRGCELYCIVFSRLLQYETDSGLVIVFLLRPNALKLYVINIVDSRVQISFYAQPFKMKYLNPTIIAYNQIYFVFYTFLMPCSHVCLFESSIYKFKRVYGVFNW